MKKVFGFFLIILALAGIFYLINTHIHTTYCCACDLDGWRFGVGIKAIYERDHVLCSCAADMGCAAAYRLIPVDMLGIAFVIGLVGGWMVFGMRPKTKFDFNFIKKELVDVIQKTPSEDENTKMRFIERVEKGAFTRDENLASHFCVYFLPYNKKTRKVFIVHHKKSGLWIGPGGHIDKGEDLHTTLNREIFEELGVKHFYKETPIPFLLTLTPIESTKRSCRFHFDIWFLMETDGSNFHVDPKEFYTTNWASFDEARKKSTNKANLKAFEIIENRP